MDIIRWIGLIFVPFLFVIRYYAKKKEHPKTVKTLLVIFFVTFVTWMGIMLKTNQLT